MSRTLHDVQELVEEGKISIHYVKTEDQLADLSTKHFSKHRHCNLIKLTNELKAQNALITFKWEDIIFLREEYLCIPHIF